MQRSAHQRYIVQKSAVYAKIWDTPTGYPIFLLPFHLTQEEKYSSYGNECAVG